MQEYRYSEAGLNLTKRYEGLRLRAYQDQGGVWTIGFGHTGPEVHERMTATTLEAEAWLRADLRDAIDCVSRAVTAPLEQRHFDALVDFCFNVGRGSFLRSTLLTHINARRMDQALGQFGLWIHVNGVINRGLQRRRAAEAAMFQGTYRANSIA